MKMTRREIIKKGIAASIIFFVPPVIYSVLKHLKVDHNDLAIQLNNQIKPDVIILDESSPEKLDFIALKYDRSKMNAPCLIWYKTDSLKLCCNKDFKTSVHAIKSYGIKNDVFIYSNKTKSNFPVIKLDLLIKEIKKSCIGNNKSQEICEDLYRVVSFIYADYYRYTKKLEARCGQRFKVDYV